MKSKKFTGVKEEESLLKEDESKTMKAEDIAFRQVEKSLTRRESASVKMKPKRKAKANRLNREDPEKSWYFTHI